MLLLKGKDMSLLSMKVDGFVHSTFENIRNFLHGVDHGGNLDV